MTGDRYGLAEVIVELGRRFAARPPEADEDVRPTSTPSYWVGWLSVCVLGAGFCLLARAALFGKRGR